MESNNKTNQFIQLSKLHFKLYLEITISIFLFILFFQPFEVVRFEFENRLLFLAGFGVIVLTFLFFSQIVFQSTLLNIEKKSRGNSVEIPLYYIVQFVTTSLGFIFYIRYVGQISISFYTVVKVVFVCLSLPVIINLNFRLRLYKQRLRKQQLEARLLQSKLKWYSEGLSKAYVEIVSEKESDNFRIQASDIVYVKSADNYVELGYIDDDIVKKRMVRNTLKNVEQQLLEFSNFIRTHRTSLVNVQYIDKLDRDKNIYFLSLDKTNEIIPVSRQYLLSIKELI